jgi:glycosyltransferase involved in cell wall biosynthesis
MSDVLAIVTAGLKPQQIADKANRFFPRVDYLELKHHIDMDILDYAVYGNTVLGKGLQHLDTILHSDVYLAIISAFRKNKYELVFTMSERAGIPFAAFNQIIPQRKPLVTIFTSWSARQERIIKQFGLVSAMDTIIVQGSGIKQNLMALGAAEECIHVIPYSVDHCFFAPMPYIEQDGNLILSVGEVRGRDYLTLLKAVDGLSVNVQIIASGYWYARQHGKNLQENLPSNVTISAYVEQCELRNLYARMQFMVLPLNSGVPGGATAALEAMCMGRAVIASRTANICDYIRDGETGLLVNPGDAGALREAIQFLIQHPEEAQRLGKNARRRIEEELNLDVYVARLAEVLHSKLY